MDFLFLFRKGINNFIFYKGITSLFSRVKKKKRKKKSEQTKLFIITKKINLKKKKEKRKGELIFFLGLVSFD